MTDQQSAGQTSAASTEAATVVDYHLEFKPNYVVKECAKEGVKFFYCVLYFPKRVKDIILRKQNPETACVKKRDAENHVALQAVKRLQTKGFLTEHLMTNYRNEKIKEHMPPSPPASSHQGGSFFKKHHHYNHGHNSHNYGDKSHRSAKSMASSMASQGAVST